MLPGGVNDEIDSHGLPIGIARRGRVDKSDRMIVNSESAVVVGQGTGEATVDRIVFEKIRETGGIVDVGDGRHFQLGVVNQQPEDISSDPAEPH